MYSQGGNEGVAAAHQKLQTDTLIARNGNDDIIAGSVDYATRGFAPLVALFNGGDSLVSYVHSDSSQSQIYTSTGGGTKESGTGHFDQLHNRLLTDLVIDFG